MAPDKSTPHSYFWCLLLRREWRGWEDGTGQLHSSLMFQLFSTAGVERVKMWLRQLHSSSMFQVFNTAREQRGWKCGSGHLDSSFMFQVFSAAGVERVGRWLRPVVLLLIIAFLVHKQKPRYSVRYKSSKFLPQIVSFKLLGQSPFIHDITFENVMQYHA